MGSGLALVLAQPVSASSQPSGYRAAAPGDGQPDSGPTLLVVAYMAIWLVAFVLLAMTLRRQRTMDARIEELSRQLEQVADKRVAAAAARLGTAAAAPKRSAKKKKNPGAGV